jgi:hypothetical protein
MDVIGFLCALLYCNMVQLHDSLDTRACSCWKTTLNSQNGDRDWGVYYRRTAFCCVFCEQKDSTQRIFIKKMLPIHGGKCLSRKAVHIWMANVSLMTKRLKRRCGSGWDNSPKRLLCCEVRRTGKHGIKLYHCWWRICGEINVVFFSWFEYHMFCVLCPFVTYLLTLPRNNSLEGGSIANIRNVLWTKKYR